MTKKRAGRVRGQLGNIGPNSADNFAGADGSGLAIRAGRSMPFDFFPQPVVELLVADSMQIYLASPFERTGYYPHDIVDCQYGSDEKEQKVQHQEPGEPFRVIFDKDIVQTHEQHDNYRCQYQGADRSKHSASNRSAL